MIGVLTLTLSPISHYSFWCANYCNEEVKMDFLLQVQGGMCGHRRDRLQIAIQLNAMTTLWQSI